MSIPSTSPALIYRPAQPEDWSSIAGWLEHTWEGGDYIDEALWRGWCGDAAGALTLVEHEGVAVAFFRLTKLGEAEWWLEGVRVRPDRRRQGLGTTLMGYVIEKFRREAHGMLRFFTGSKNEAMAKLARASGFVHIMSYTQMEALAGAVDYRNFKVLLPQNLEILWNYLRANPMYRANRFAERQWVAYYLTHDRLSEYLNDRNIQVIGWRQFDHLQGLTILFPDNTSNALEVGCIAAPDDTTLKAMLDALRGLAAYRGKEKVAWKMPLTVGLERPLALTDYRRAWEDEDLWLFELPLRS